MILIDESGLSWVTVTQLRLPIGVVVGVSLAGLAMLRIGLKSVAAVN